MSAAGIIENCRTCSAIAGCTGRNWCANPSPLIGGGCLPPHINYSSLFVLHSSPAIEWRSPAISQALRAQTANGLLCARIPQAGAPGGLRGPFPFPPVRIHLLALQIGTQPR